MTNSKKTKLGTINQLDLKVRKHSGRVTIQHRNRKAYNRVTQKKIAHEEMNDQDKI